MSITIKTRKILWSKSGNKCAFPNCKADLIESSLFTDDSHVVGDEAHIIPQSKNGPRGEDFEKIPIENIDKEPNLLLLCKKHHKIIDDDPINHSVAKLHSYKKEHEEWVHKTLNFNIEQIRDELEVISYIEEWEKRINIDEWINWTNAPIFLPKNMLSEEIVSSFLLTDRYIKSRIWPNKFQVLKESFDIFGNLLNDLYWIYSAEGENVRGEYWITMQTTIGRAHTLEAYQYKEEECLFISDLVTDLLIELTRIGNFLIKLIRKNFSQNYRSELGFLLIRYSNPILVQYKDDQILYEGIYKFILERNNRDLIYGKSDDKRFIDKFEAF